MFAVRRWTDANARAMEMVEVSNHGDVTDSSLS